MASLDDIFTDEKEVTKEENANIQKAKSKKDHIQTFIKSLVAIEKELSSIRESRKDIIDDYINNDYLTKEEIKKIKQAISLAKKLDKLAEIEDYFDEASKIV